MPGGFPVGPEICGGTDIGTVAASSHGTSVAVSANTAGSWVQLIAATVSDCCQMLVQLGPPNGSAYLAAIDIGVGASGSEHVVAQQLMVCGATNIAGAQNHLIPCSIPAASRIAARGQGSAADTALVSIILFDGGFNNMEGCGGVDAIGFVAASTTGTAITPNPTANTKATAYTQLVAATARDYIGFIVSFASNGVSVTNADYLIDIAIGASGSEINIIPNLHITPAGYIQSPNNAGPFFVGIPAGTRLSARAAASVASSTAVGLVLYGIYL